MKFKSSKLIITIFVVACAMALTQGKAYCEPAKDGGSVTLKIMSLNLRHHVDFWDDRSIIIADEITKLSPDIIGLQEIMLTVEQAQQVRRMVIERGGPDYEIYEKMKTGIDAMSGEGVGIMSRFPMLKKGMVDLKHGRPGVIARIQVNDDIIIDMANTHLHNKGGDDVRAPQAETLLKFIHAKSGPYPVFLTGDMNATPETKTIANIVNYGFIDSYLTFNGPEKAKAEGSTSPITLGKDNPKQNLHNRIDYVFYKPGGEGAPTVRILDSIVCFKNIREDGLYPTDHLGVMTTFELTPAK